MDLTNHVVLPREDFIELQTAAWQQPELKDRVASTLQSLIVVAAVASIVPIGSWAHAKAQNWRDDKAFIRKELELDLLQERSTQN